MFDYRYHALSLAAVLFALAVGVLIGVAIGDSDLVSSAKNGIVRNLRSEVSGARGEADQLSHQLNAQHTFENDVYPIVVHSLLANRKIGLVFLGESSDQVNGLVREAVTQAGGELVSVMAVREPLDLSGLGKTAAATPTGAHYLALAENPRLVGQFGLRMGVQLITGGELLSHVQTHLLSSFDGQLGGLSGVVVMRSEPAQMTAEQSQSTSEFESGLIAGITKQVVPAVGVELSDTEPSQVPWYKNQEITSVDDLDSLAGRIAVVFALTGAHGTYGAKPTAESGLLPRAVGSVALP